jgi:hypothetical protein
MVATSEAGRGTGSISGLVFADWNSNGVQDSGENTLEGIRLTLGAGARLPREMANLRF